MESRQSMPLQVTHIPKTRVTASSSTGSVMCNHMKVDTGLAVLLLACHQVHARCDSSTAAACVDHTANFGCCESGKHYWCHIHSFQEYTLEHAMLLIAAQQCFGGAALQRTGDIRHNKLEKTSRYMFLSLSSVCCNRVQRAVCKHTGTMLLILLDSRLGSTS